MTNFNNNDLYEILLDRLRKDRKGSVNPEEFESFLRQRNVGYFNQQFKLDGASQLNIDSLEPFVVPLVPLAIGHAVDYFVTLPTTAGSEYAHVKNAFYSTSSTSFTSRVKIDIVSDTELLDRLSNAITGPFEAYPVGYIADGKLYIYGPTAGYVILSYYKYPSDPYFDYYVDVNGNITYLTEGQSAYTLQTGEESRDGSVAGDDVTSASVDLEWGDQDAVNILDMVMTDVGIAVNATGVAQASLTERQNNVKS